MSKSAERELAELHTNIKASEGEKDSIQIIKKQQLLISELQHVQVQSAIVSKLTFQAPGQRKTTTS
jgi:hypothetical protein